VPVKLISVVFYEDASGKRIVDVNNGGDVTGAHVSPPSDPNSSTPRRYPTRTNITVDLSDLLEAGILRVDEPIEWRRPQLGQIFKAKITPSGAVVTEDGRPFTSLSTAADSLAGGSYNGWECWTVPRRNGVKIGLFRAELVSPDAGGLSSN
jgi:hypothetical protein